MSERQPDPGAARRTPSLQAGRHGRQNRVSPPRSGAKAFLLALLVHALLVAMLVSGIRWQTHAPEGVSAELWLPADAPEPPAAEPEVRPAPTPSTHAPQLPPRTVDALARRAQAPAEAMDPDIAIEQVRRARAERQRAEEEQKRRAAEEAARLEAERQARQEAEARARQEAEKKARIEAEEKLRQEREREARAAEERLREQKAKEEQARQEAEEKARREAKEKEQRAAEEKTRQEKEAAAKAKREAEAKAKREAEEKAKREAEAKAKREADAKAKREAEAKAKREAEQKAQKEREAKERAQYLEGLREQAGSGSGTGASGSAGSGADAGYAAQLSGIIRSNTVFLVPPGLSGNPKAVFHVRLTPEGRIRSVELVRSSGLPSWDAAAQRGIERSDPLPKRADGTVPDSIEITSGPLDDH